MGIQQIFMADGPYGPDREATGGTITTYGGYTIHTFKTSGSLFKSLRYSIPLLVIERCPSMLMRFCFCKNISKSF